MEPDDIVQGEPLDLDTAIEQADAELGGETPPQAQAQPDPPFEPPARWPKEVKDSWLALHGYPDSRTHLERLHKQWSETQKYITHQEQARAALEKQYNPINELIAPYAQQWAMQGMDTQQGMRQLFGYAQALASDPKGTLLQLAEMYGVDLRTALEDQPYVDPVTQQLQQQVQQLQSHLQQQQHMGMQSQQQSLIREIQAFESATDEAGNPKYPHFADLYEDMTMLVQMGRASDLESAYQLASRFNPEVQERMAAAKQEAVRQEALRKAQGINARTQQALAASGTVKGKGGKPTGRKSIDDVIREAEAELSAR